MLILGFRGDNNGVPFDGYIDDVRIYNRALTATQVKALYDANAGANATNTTPPTSASITMPVRSLVYNTPSIPANSWQKVQLTIPADSTGAWETRQGFATANLVLNLGAGSSYSNVTTNVWNNNTAFNGGVSTQLINYSSNAFLATSANAVLMTGVQLEKGAIVTPFDVRPTNVEKTLLNKVVVFASASLTGGVSGYYSSTDPVILKFNNVWINTYNSYNASSGIFTVPMAGYYRCSVSWFGGRSGLSRIILYLNGNIYPSTNSRFENNANGYNIYSQNAGEKIVYCNVNDTLMWYYQTNGNTLYLNEDMTTMTITMI
jgi:hypothetical protein